MVNLPFGVKRDVLAGHQRESISSGQTNVRVPTREGITGLGRGAWRCDRRSGFLRDISDGATAVFFKCNGIRYHY